MLFSPEKSDLYLHVPLFNFQSFPHPFQFLAFNDAIDPSLQLHCYVTWIMILIKGSVRPRSDKAPNSQGQRVPLSMALNETSYKTSYMSIMVTIIPYLAQFSRYGPKQCYHGGQKTNMATIF